MRTKDFSLKKADPLLDLARRHVPELTAAGVEDQTFIPGVARDGKLLKRLREAVREVETTHRLVVGDSRDLSAVEDRSVHLVVTSPPYWTLKKYNDHDAQLAEIEDYEKFNDELTRVWTEVYRVLVPGGRLVIVVGDVCVSRRAYGRHLVFPLHATIQERCRGIGFDNLAPIIWYKIANAQYEAGGGGFLGKPYEPNAIVKNDIEYILLQRKPGAYRRPMPGMRVLSVIATDEYQAWFRQVWQVPGASTREHPAPYPLELADRLVRMFSFVGDTVLDPFAGTGTTMVACANAGRNSVGYEVDEKYAALCEGRFRRDVPRLTQPGVKLSVERQGRNERDYVERSEYSAAAGY